MVAYGLALHSAAAAIGGVVNTYVNVQGFSPDPIFIGRVEAQVSSYIQQEVTPVWTYYLVIGIALAVCGTILVAIGDRKPASAEKEGPFRSQPLLGKRQ
jgi:hypothetical protein